MKCADCPGPGPTCDGERFPRLCVLAATRADYRALLAGETPIASPPPSLFGKAANFAGAVVRHALAGLPKASDGEKARRLAICEACPNFTEARSCRLCGCTNMDLKASWADQACPDSPPRW